MRMHRNMSNLEVAKLLRAVAAAYEVKPGDHRFQRIAYERAADAVEHATSEVKDLWDDKKLEDVAGIGKAIAEHLDELFRTGRVKHFEDLMKGQPPAMFELLDLPGVGAKSALKLTRELGITRAHDALKKLAKAAEKGHIRKIVGFGEQSEKEILGAIREVRERTKRLLLPYASSIAEDVVAWLKKNPNVKRADPLGSLRRRVSTVGDVDIAVASAKPAEVIQHFAKYPKKVKLIEAGEATSSILLPGGVQVDLMVQPPDSYGALLQHFTGSKHHNIALRTLAQKKGLSLSEYGIKKKMANGKWKMENTPTEQEFYAKLGLDWIPPELREDRGEIEAARKGRLPRLLELKDIKGDFHIHSNELSQIAHDEGADPMQEYVEEAQRLGYEYIAFSEHNLKSELSERKILVLLKRRNEKIDKINYSRENRMKTGVKKVFKSLEIDILPDGKLALPEKALELLDFAIASIHSSFRGSKVRQTRRVLNALEHPKVRIFGHPTARLLNQREAVELDWDKIFSFCREKKKWLEVNAWHDRLDLPDVLVQEAVKQGVKLVINTDSHKRDHMQAMGFGVSVARRGWAEKSDIINTLTYNKLLTTLKVS